MQPHNEPHWRSTRLRNLQRKPTESESSSRRDPPPEYLHVIEEKKREEEELPTYSEAVAVETHKCEALENGEYRCRKSEASKNCEHSCHNCELQSTEREL